MTSIQLSVSINLIQTLSSTLEFGGQVNQSSRSTILCLPSLQLGPQTLLCKNSFGLQRRELPKQTPMVLFTVTATCYFLYTKHSFRCHKRRQQPHVFVHIFRCSVYTKPVIATARRVLKSHLLLYHLRRLR